MTGANKLGASLASLAALALVLAWTAATWGLWVGASQPEVRHRPHPDAFYAVVADRAAHGLPIEATRDSYFIESMTWNEAANTFRSAPFLLARAILTRHALTRTTTLLPQAIGLAVLIVAVFAIGWIVRDAPTGALAAALAAWTPTYFGLSLEFNDHLWNLAALAVAAAFVLASDGLRRWWWLAAAGAVLGAGAARTFIWTHGVLMALSALAVLGGTAMAPPAHEGGRISRRRRALGAAVFFAATALAFIANGGGATLGYLMTEMGHTVGRPGLAACAAYVDVIWRVQQGPALVILTLATAPQFWRRTPGSRWALAAWLVVPLVLLSAIPKKNDYYIFLAQPPLALIAASGLMSIRRSAWRRAAIAAALGVVFYATMTGLTHAPRGRVEGFLLPNQAPRDTFGAFQFGGPFALARPPLVTPTADGALADAVGVVARARRLNEPVDLLMLVREQALSAYYLLALAAPQVRIAHLATIDQALAPAVSRPLLVWVPDAIGEDTNRPSFAAALDQFAARTAPGTWQAPAQAQLELLRATAADYRLADCEASTCLYDRKTGP